MLRTIITPRLTASLTKSLPLTLNKRILSKRNFTVASSQRQEEDNLSSQFKHTQTSAGGKDESSSSSDYARRLSQAVLPKLERPNVKKVCIVGSGGLSIGQVSKPFLSR